MTKETDELRAYVRRALESGQSPEAIRTALDRAGWDGPRIDRAIGAWETGANGLAVPRPRPQVSAREAFLYLTLFAALYLTAWYLGVLMFELIEIAIADPAEGAWRDRSRGRAIRWAIAALVVALPLYLTLSVTMSREMRADPARRYSPVRLWLGHMTLFVAALVVIGALVGTIYSLLAGELTLRFILKVLTVTVIAAAIFGYYRVELGTDRR